VFDSPTSKNRFSCLFQWEAIFLINFTDNQYLAKHYIHYILTESTCNFNRRLDRAETSWSIVLPSILKIWKAINNAYTDVGSRTTIYQASNLLSVCAHLHKRQTLSLCEEPSNKACVHEHNLSEVKGLVQVKRALTIAAAGQHTNALTKSISSLVARWQCMRVTPMELHRKL